MTSPATLTPFPDVVSLADLDALSPQAVEAATAGILAQPKDVMNADACTELPDWQPRSGRP